MHNAPLTKIGYVTIVLRGRSLRLRFTFPKGTRHEFTVAKESVAGMQKAKAIANWIDKDIHSGAFDESLKKYRE